MRITSKGQVTIPQHVREKAKLVPGSEVEFIEEKGRIYIRKVASSFRGQELVERMTGKGTVHMTTDEILRLTRGDR